VKAVLLIRNDTLFRISLILQQRVHYHSFKLITSYCLLIRKKVLKTENYQICT